MSKRRVFVVGVSAFIGGGKDYIADILVDKYGFYKVSPGDITREIMKRAGAKITREAQEKLTKGYIEKYGKDFVMELCYKKIISSKKDKIVVPGIRYPNDAMFYKKKLDGDFVNIFVDAPRKIRYKRLISRKREDVPDSYSDFLKQDTAQQERYDLKSTRKISDFRLNNGRNESKKLIKSLEKILTENNVRF